MLPAFSELYVLPNTLLVSLSREFHNCHSSQAIVLQVGKMIPDATKLISPEFPQKCLLQLIGRPTFGVFLMYLLSNNGYHIKNFDLLVRGKQRYENNALYTEKHPKEKVANFLSIICVSQYTIVIAQQRIQQKQVITSPEYMPYPSDDKLIFLRDPYRLKLQLHIYQIELILFLALGRNNIYITREGLHESRQVGLKF